MDIKTFKTVAGNLPADIAILMRGPTGVGKSHLGKAIADEKERRRAGHHQERAVAANGKEKRINEE